MRVTACAPRSQTLRADSGFFFFLRSLKGLDSSCIFTHLIVSNNDHIRSLRGLASTPCLRLVMAEHCDLRSLGGLSACKCLVEVHVGGNALLKDVSGVANLTALELLAVPGCGVNLDAFRYRGIALIETWPVSSETVSRSPPSTVEFSTEYYELNIDGSLLCFYLCSANASASFFLFFFSLQME